MAARALIINIAVAACGAPYVARRVISRVASLAASSRMASSSAHARHGIEQWRQKQHGATSSWRGMYRGVIWRAVRHHRILSSASHRASSKENSAIASSRGASWRAKNEAASAWQHQHQRASAWHRRWHHRVAASYQWHLLRCAKSKHHNRVNEGISVSACGAACRGALICIFASQTKSVT